MRILLYVSRNSHIDCQKIGTENELIIFLNNGHIKIIALSGIDGSVYIQTTKLGK